MSETNENPYQTPETSDEIYVAQVSETPQKRGKLKWVFLAWFFIVAIVAFHIVTPFLVEETEVAGSSRSNLMVMQIQGKVLVGGNELELLGKTDLKTQLSTLNIGPLDQRFAHAILVNEFFGAEEALESLKKTSDLVVKNGYKPTRTQQDIRNVLSDVFVDYQNEKWGAPSLSDEEREFLKTEYGWLGLLALTTDESKDWKSRDQVVNPAKTSMIAMMVMTGLGMLTFIAGGFGLVIIGVTLFANRMHMRTSMETLNGRIYAETFGVWMITFLAIQITLGFFLADAPIITKLIVQLFAFFGSLVALFWAPFRGIAIGEFLGDIGWKQPKSNPFVEIFWGVVSYVCALPILFLGMICTLFLMVILSIGENPNSLDAEQMSHPIMELLVHSELLGLVVIALTTVVAAPIVEETVFRGVLYRHLRDGSAKYGRIISCFISAILNALIFAAIHPQGIAAIPVLASLALAFSLVREWRGSLVAPMVMHGVHNGLITTMCAFFFL